ncbi:MAG TPA: hypothetical protein EYH59_00420 [Pyrodictium sp.]|nr:hypothetical protein [Pyrodictium sp.]
MAKSETIKAIAYVTIIAIVAALAVASKLTFRQIVSVVTLAIFIGGSLFYWQFRNAFALVGVALLFFLGVMDVKHFIEFSQLDVVIFIVGTMIIIGVLEEREFFDWLIARMLRPVIHSPTALIVVLLLLSFLMSALVGEVTSILFMMAITFKILEVIGVDPLPFIIFIVFATNIGSSATVVGNPIGVMIAFDAGFSFMDFIRWSTVEAIVSVFITSGIAALILSPYIRQIQKKINSGEIDIARLFEVKWRPELRGAFALFIGVLAGLIVHHQLEILLNLPHNSLLLAVPLIGAGIGLFMERHKAREIVEKRIDWWTLLYFLLLFASVGTLEYTGVTDVIAEAIYGLSQGDLVLAMLLVGLVAGFLTALMDNVLAVATLMPILHSLAEHMNVFLLWWVLLKAGTYWGNATVIGSTANIVAAGYVEKKLKRGFSMWGWMKIGIPVSAITYIVAFLWLYAQMGIAPTWVPPTH